MGTARVVCDADERTQAARALRAQAITQGPPDAIKPLLKRIGFDYDAEVRKMDDTDPSVPTVAITRALPDRS